MVSKDAVAKVKFVVYELCISQRRQSTWHAIFLSSDSYDSEEQKANRKRFPLLFPPLQIFLMLDLIQKVEPVF